MADGFKVATYFVDRKRRLDVTVLSTKTSSSGVIVRPVQEVVTLVVRTDPGVTTDGMYKIRTFLVGPSGIGTGV